MGAVCITSSYPKFNGSHFDLPPSSIHRMTGLGGNFPHTMTYAHRPHSSQQHLLDLAALLSVQVLHSILVEQQGVEEGTHQLGLIVNGMRQQEASTSTEGGGDAEEKEKVDLMALPCFRTLNALCTSTPEESKEDSSDAVPSSEQSDSPEKSTGQTSAVLESPNTRTSLASNPDTPGTSAACSAPGSSRGSSKYIDAAVLPDLSEAPDFPLPIPGEDTVDDFPFGLGVASTNAPHESDVERPVFTENPWDPVERMPFCSFCCGVSVPDPKPEQLVLFLHALSYKVGDYVLFCFCQYFVKSFAPC